MLACNHYLENQKVSTVVTTTVAERRKRSRLKRIVVSERNYFALKELGRAGDSFNDVVSKLLRIERGYQEMKQQQEQQENNDKNSSSNNSNNGSELLSPPGPFALFEKQNKQQISELVRLLRGKRRGKCCSINNQTNEQEINGQEA
jgi:predicted CopG family antitoxin